MQKVTKNLSWQLCLTHDLRTNFFSGAHEKINAEELLDEKVAEITGTDEPSPNVKQQTY